MNSNNTSFAPQLFINKGIHDLSFYTAAFGAVEQIRFNNDDGSMHVIEFSIDGAIFYVHEVMADPYFFTPALHNGSTILVVLCVPDVDAVMAQALNAGATLVSAATDYDYGYRQGEIMDPFGHVWLLQKKI